MPRPPRDNVKRGLIFALKANGASCYQIAPVVGISRERVQQLDADVMRAIRRAADRRFGRLWDGWRFYG